MWPFRKDDRDAEILRLREALAHADDALVDASERRDAAISALETISKAVTPIGLANIVNNATREIADVFAQGHQSVHARDSRVWAIVHSAVSRATTGKVVYNTDALARAATEDRRDG